MRFLLSQELDMSQKFVVKSPRHSSHYDSKSINGKLRPIDAPTVFDTCDIKPSQVPTPSAKPRSNKRALSENRNAQNVQTNKMLREELVVRYEDLRTEIHQRIAHLSNCAVIAYICNNSTHFQSEDFAVGGIPKFLLKINPDLSFEAFYSEFSL